MEKEHFKVIKGGMTSRALPENRRFVSAYITDTRLMGVLVLHIHWIFDRKHPDPDFHQFFYIDCEETGIELYRSLFTENNNGVSEVFRSMADGLGGEKHKISEAGARYVLKEFAAFNKRTGTEYPRGFSEYGFMIEEETGISEAAVSKLLNKECETIEKDNQLINYFLMRGLGEDERAFSLLTDDSSECGRMFEDLKGFMMHRNIISRTSDENIFICETLIEKDLCYSTMISEIHLEGIKVKYAKRKRLFPVSSDEVHMILSRSEFVSHYITGISVEDFRSLFSFRGLRYTLTKYGSGFLYTVYDRNNSHVSSDEYLIYNDVQGLIFITVSGELLITAYSEKRIRPLENRVEKLMCEGLAAIEGKYEFPDPVMYTFITSGTVNFDEFIELITK